MNIIVCMKQIPDTSEIKIDPVTNTLIRAGVPSIINPYDRNALEAAVQLKEQHGGTVTVVCMGPPAAKEALTECISYGADRGILVTDRQFGGSDTYATSYILACAIQKLGEFDLIICGKQAMDGDTGQVGASMSEHLNIPQLTYAVKIEVAGDKVKVNREVDEGIMVLETKMPAIITVGKDINEPRSATIKSKMKAKKTELEEITAADMPDIDQQKIGLKGSPTRVKKTFTPSVKKMGIKIVSENTEETVKALCDYITSKELLS